MKKFYTSVIFIAAFYVSQLFVETLQEHAAGFATAQLSASFSITVLSIGFCIVTFATAYKLTPKI